MDTVLVLVAALVDRKAQEIVDDDGKVKVFNVPAPCGKFAAEMLLRQVDPWLQAQPCAGVTFTLVIVRNDGARHESGAFPTPLAAQCPAAMESLREILASQLPPCENSCSFCHPAKSPSSILSKMLHPPHK